MAYCKILFTFREVSFYHQAAGSIDYLLCKTLQSNYKVLKSAPFSTGDVVKLSL